MALRNPELATTGTWPFPKDDISPKEKDQKPFHYAIGRAIWSYAAAYDTHLFYNDRDKYRKYRRYALGEQSEDKYKPFLNEEKNTDNEKGWLKAINFAIKNYATKRINITIAKMHAKDYDVVVDMTDPISKGIMENIKMALAVKMKNKKKLQRVAKIFEDDIADNIPDDRESLQIMLDNDFKMIEAMHLELAIPHHLERNRYEDHRKLVDFDLTVLGVGGMYVGMDENLKPYFERVNPSDVIAPYSETPNLEDLPYIAVVKWVTVAQFRKMAIGYMPDESVNRLIDEFAKKRYQDGLEDRSDINQYDDVQKIALLHYNYKSTDTLVFLEKSDDFGNPAVFEKDIDYYSTPKELKKFDQKFQGDRKIHRKTINAVYEGFWVIGSEDNDSVFRQGRRSYSTDAYGVFSNTGMGFKLFAPNTWDGRVTSMAAQMIPILDELQRYNLKVQQLVARAIPKGIGIDLYALRKANLKWGGKGMTDQEKIEMFMKSGIFIFSSKDRYAAGSNYKPFYEAENGLANDIGKYLDLIHNALLELDEIIGINKAVAASNIREDAGKAVTEIQVGAAEVALDHLYKADQKIYKQVVQDIGRLHMQSYIYSAENRADYDRMFGVSGAGQNAIRFDMFDYSFNIEVRPTAAEWTDIYQSAEKAYDKGILSYSDTLYLREFKSLKQARQWLILKEKQALKAASEGKQADIQANAQVQQQSLQAKNVADLKLAETKQSNALMLEQAKRETITHAANTELAKEEQLLTMQAGEDRRENQQEGKIKDRHIEAEGEIDITIAAMGKAQQTPTAKPKPKKVAA